MVTKLLKKSLQLVNGKDKLYGSRRAAFRDAKRKNDIPVSKNPAKSYSPSSSEWERLGMDERNKRFYFFTINEDTEREKKIHIREDKSAFIGEKGFQPDHFNAGEAWRKLKQHFYYKK